MLRQFLLRHRHAALAARVADGPLADYLAVPLPDPAAAWSQVDYVALDIETTGLDPQTDAMLSAGWVLVQRGRVEMRTAQSLLVRPDMGVGQSATVHGLTDTQLAAGEDLETVLRAILTVLAGRVLLVHYAHLDLGLIERLCRERFGSAPPLQVVDTLQLERRRRRHRGPSAGSLRLGDLRTDYALPRYAAHNCLTDAIATAELFLAMVARRRDSDLRLRDLL